VWAGTARRWMCLDRVSDLLATAGGRIEAAIRGVVPVGVLVWPIALRFQRSLGDPLWSMPCATGLRE
jgi:hypothetical protein